MTVSSCAAVVMVKQADGEVTVSVSDQTQKNTEGIDIELRLPVDTVVKKQPECYGNQNRLRCIAPCGYKGLSRQEFFRNSFINIHFRNLQGYNMDNFSKIRTKVYNRLLLGSR